MNPTAQTLEARPELVAACGLYCGACKSFLKGKCPGCRENKKASWCKVRSCNLEHNTSSCAQCSEFVDPMACKKFNNVISKAFGFVFNSDRGACIRQIRDQGIEGHAQTMTSAGRMTIAKRG